MVRKLASRKARPPGFEDRLRQRPERIHGTQPGGAPQALHRHASRRTTVAAIQRSAGNRAANNFVQRHPNHAEEQEVLRMPATGAIQRESKAKKKARLEGKYGVTITGDIPESMLKKIDDILKLLPRSHTKGNAALQEISGGGGIGANASAYDSDKNRLEINTPEMMPGKKMPTWLYLLLSKGIKWQRAMMDEGAMADFDIDADQDQELGLDAKGKRQVMAGASDVLAKGNLVSWTLRHESGHAVDAQIKFTTARGKLPQFGGWRMYDIGEDAQMKELATAFLRKAGFTTDQIDVQCGQNPSKSLRDSLAQRISNGNVGIAPAWQGAFKTGLGMTQAAITAKFEALETTMKIAQAHPWTFSDGGGDLIRVDDRMYHRDHYGQWVSYLADARANALSNYQFSSPGEWFAEVYAAIYDGKKKSAARDTLAAPVKEWFYQNLGPPSFKERDAEQSKGKLADNQGNLQTLQELDDAVLAALSNPNQAVAVELDDLPADLQSDAGRMMGF